MTNGRWIFSGGPGTGKTTTLLELQRRGYATVPEVAREIIRERLGAGLPPRPSPKEFAQAVYDADLRNYVLAEADGLIFFDRSLSDSLGMLAECETIDAATARARLAEHPFEGPLFFFPFWPEIYNLDSERDQTPEQAAAISKAIRAWHIDMGFELITVPPGNVAERADFILSVVDPSNSPIEGRAGRP